MGIERPGESHFRKDIDHKEESEIDPDKFKKILEVESSTEKEKRKKKRPEETLEEIEEERRNAKRRRSRPNELYQPESHAVEVSESEEAEMNASEEVKSTDSDMPEAKKHIKTKGSAEPAETLEVAPSKNFNIKKSIRETKKKSKDTLRPSKRTKEEETATIPVGEVDEADTATEEEESYEEEPSSVDLDQRLAKERSREDQPPLVEATNLPDVESIESNMISHLPNDMYEIFEKISAHMLVQGTKLEGEIKITLDMPHSVFDESTITLKHYATNPGAFHIELEGSPEAAELFNLHLKNLEGALAQAYLNSEIHIKKAAIATPKKKKPLFHRKEKLP